VCDNENVTLMCHTNQTTGNMITWYWSNQSQHGDTITVVARMTEVVYTCAVSNNGENFENVTIAVKANGEYNYRGILIFFEIQSACSMTWCRGTFILKCRCGLTYLEMHSC